MKKIWATSLHHDDHVSAVTFDLVTNSKVPFAVVLTLSLCEENCKMETETGLQ